MIGICAVAGDSKTLCVTKYEEIFVIRNNPLLSRKNCFLCGIKNVNLYLPNGINHYSCDSVSTSSRYRTNMDHSCPVFFSFALVVE